MPDEKPVISLSEAIAYNDPMLKELIGEHGEEIDRIASQAPRGLPNWEKPAETEDWFTRTSRQNQEMAKAYGVEVNALGASLGPEVLLITEQVKRYYLNHPEDVFKQKTYSQLLEEGKIAPMLPRPEPTVIKNSTSTEVLKAITEMSKEERDRLISALKEMESPK